MVPEHLKFGGGASATVLHPLVVALLLVALVLIWCLPRKYVIAPLLGMGLSVPYGQQLVIGGLHFPALRILILAGCIRMAASRRGKGDSLDKLFIVWAACRAIAFVLLFMTSAALVNQVAFLMDSLGGFFLLRFLVRDHADIRRTVTVLVFVAVIVACSMAVEHIGHVNPFGYLGSVDTAPQVRGDSLRAQGPFAHPILAGVFGATLLPLFVWLWAGARFPSAAMVGIASSTAITLMSASSTPLMAYVTGMLTICLWPLRRRLATLRWACVSLIVALALVMKAPVWFLIARVDLVGGSSGYHRALLIDQFIRHFFDWWLIGTDANADWGWDLWDTSNQFVAEGQTGGLVVFVCFIALIWICFRRIGNARRSSSGERKAEWFYWLLGATLLSHVVAFFGISYFDQTRMSWFALLAIIIAATGPATQSARSQRTAVRRRGETLPDSRPMPEFASPRNELLHPAS